MQLQTATVSTIWFAMMDQSRRLVTGAKLFDYFKKIGSVCLLVILRQPERASRCTALASRFTNR